jgi:hypothetical protein
MRIGGFGGRGPLAVAREVVALTFRGSRSDLERVTGLRFEAALVLIFLATRCVHLGQAAVDLSLAGSRYTREMVAVGLGGACLVESLILAAVCLRIGRLSPAAMLADAAFGAVGLGVMAVATTAMPGRAGSLDWMLPYTVATAAGLGLLAGGDLIARPDPRARSGTAGSMVTGRRWPGAVAVALAAVYVVSVVLPRRLPDEHWAQIGGNTANYVVFFAAACLAKLFVRQRLSLIASRSAEVTRAAAQVAHEAQWRAVAVDVFGPVVALLDGVAQAEDGKLAASITQEADRLISMIEAVRPLDGDARPNLERFTTRGAESP